MTKNDNCNADYDSSLPPSDTTQHSGSTTFIAATSTTSTTTTTVDANVDVNIDGTTVDPTVLKRRKYIRNFKLHTMQDDVLIALLKYPNTVGLYHKRLVTTTTGNNNSNNDSTSETTTTTTTTNGLRTNGNWIRNNDDDGWTNTNRFLVSLFLQVYRNIYHQ